MGVFIPRIMLHPFIPCYGSSILGPSKNIRFVPEFMCQALKIAKKSANEFACVVCHDLTCIRVVIWFQKHSYFPMACVWYPCSLRYWGINVKFVYNPFGCWGRITPCYRDTVSEMRIIPQLIFLRDQRFFRRASNWAGISCPDSSFLWFNLWHYKQSLQKSLTKIHVSS